MNETNKPAREKWNFLLVLALMGLALFLGLLLAASQQRAATAAPVGAQSDDGLWQDVNEALLRLEGDRPIVPTAYRTVSLDWSKLNALLAAAPEGLDQMAVSDVVLSLPLPDGGYGRFQVSETAVMHPDLAAKFPDIKTYAGIGLDDATAYARLDTTPHGFHAMILSVNGRVFIDPYTSDGIDLYQSYFARDFVPDLPADFAPDQVIEIEEATENKPEAITGAVASGSQLHTYRLAMAATGEYTQFHGGTVNQGLSAIVTAVNRVAGIYEREVAVTFQLIANNDQIIYTNGATDPYTNNSGSTMLGQNQTNLDSVIGSSNYDVGHVFSTGGGGVAWLASVCNASTKARGVTGLNTPVGDPFYVDYVAHEMGHQFAGNHTFNGSAGSCAGGNRNAATAYEPGSGTTIMAYAGICSPQNIQSNSNDYFHGISFDEIVSFITSGNGNSCAAVSNTGNTAPTVNAGANYSIPLNTPFTLTGSATDPDGTAVLTYNWEEFDLGPAGAPNSPSGSAPIFRSFPATATPSRTFPRISDIVNNTQTMGELLPGYGRTMTFRLTVRDNQSPAGGVAYDSAQVTAVSGTGPFLVTAPNTAVTWTGSTNQTVTWNVAGTNTAPISCANVNIQLSTDGGFTYPTILAANTANDGSATVVAPNISTSAARVRVSCAGSIFFDISNANFTIQLGDPSLTVSKSVNPTGSVAPGDTLTYSIEVNNSGGPANNTTVTDTFDSALVNPVCNGVPGDLIDTVVINPSQSVAYVCTAVVDPSLALDVDISANPAVIVSTETTTYTISVTNSHSSLSLSSVQVSAPGVTGCTPALGSSQTLGPGVSQIYTCPNVNPASPAATTATATGQLTISNVAQANDPDDPGGSKSSSPVNTQVVVTSRDSFAVYFSDYFYGYLPLIAR
ncbi:MAG: hypothetical protein IPM53_07230 [Anaerolineaceae bacterium]|nr:hypothetical protein [Anaerolineaceae bacterium]